MSENEKMITHNYYYAGVDENDVLCVDQLDGSAAYVETEAAKIAEMYPGTICFAVPVP